MACRKPEVNWLIEGVLAQSKYPETTELAALWKQGIRALVSVEEREDADALEQGFECLEEPIEDFTAPSLEQLSRIVDFIEAMRAQGKPVLVHCLIGGRSGGVLAAYLIHRGFRPDEALRRAKQLVPSAADYPEIQDALREYGRAKGRD